MHLQTGCEGPRISMTFENMPCSHLCPAGFPLRRRCLLSKPQTRLLCQGTAAADQRRLTGHEGQHNMVREGIGGVKGPTNGPNRGKQAHSGVSSMVQRGLGCPAGCQRTTYYQEGED